MNRRMIILRHAQSIRNDHSLVDHDRPLDSRGVRDSSVIGLEIYRRGWKPDRIFVSSSLRTIQTLENLGPEFSEIQKEIRGEMYNAPLENLLPILENSLDDSTTMIIGHNPGCEMLLESTTGNMGTMSTASAALLSEEDGNWNLIELIRPKDLN